MHTALLVTGKHHALGGELARELLNHDMRVFATHDPDRDGSDTSGDDTENLSWIAWNRPSLLSARSVLLALEVERVRPTHAVLLCGPEGVHNTLHEADPAQIEATVDAAIKGYLFMAREILSLFSRIGAGDLSIMWHDGGAEVLAPVDSIIAGAVRSLTASLFTFYQAEQVTVRGLESSESSPRGTAEWVREMIFDRGSRTAGKWQRHGQRSGIIPFRR